MKKIWYNRPASHWREALPIGNGYTGVMVYGGKRMERLCFNDGTLWSGYPKDYNSAESLKNLKAVRKLVFEGKNNEADALAQKKLCGWYSETFLPLGTVAIRFHGASRHGYRRELDLENGIHTVMCAGVKREAFSSYPDRVTVYHITSRNPISLTVRMSSKLHSGVSCENGMYLTGNAPDYVAPNYLVTKLFPVKYNEKKGMAFCLGMRVASNGEVAFGRNAALIKNATDVTLYFVTDTGFQGYGQMPCTDRAKVKKHCEAALDTVPFHYGDLKVRHSSDVSELFHRQCVSLGANSDLPTDELLKSVKAGGDMRPLCELFYNYGKYMTISASRRGGQAMNLQGIWNKSVRPPWSSNYTVNINTQMNYWGASQCGLDECIEPLLQMVSETMKTGKKTAEINYGCGGFACNHNVDLWRKTPPVQGTANYMLEPLCGVWLANEIYGHYKNGALQAYREKVLEITEEAARFAVDYLVLHDGRYVICPSASPENRFLSNGKSAYLDYASAFDMGLVRQSFANALELSENTGLKEKINERLLKLYPFQKGENGICEWHRDYETPEKGHRHFSPLYAFYPAKLIGFYKEKEQTAWVHSLFEYRLKNSGQHIGWSAAWAICIAARLRDATTAERVTRGFLCNAVFRNLFCVHPPSYFQIDGNLGYVAGLNEMLITEENGVAELLPALPGRWDSGSVSNIVINGKRISFQWRNGAVTEIASDRPIKVRDRNISAAVQTNSYIELVEDNV